MIEKLLRNRLATSVVLLVLSLMPLAHSLGWTGASLSLWVKIVFAVLVTAWAIVLGKWLWRELADVDLSED